MKQKRNRIRLEEILGSALLTVEKPARYLGGEVASLTRDYDDDTLLFALSFPDLYEIGMSNNAIRILYSMLNELKGVRCERVFAPAPDFEKLLASEAIPLCTLESGTALCDVDIIGFSLGYELAATSVLSILESGHIPIRREERGEDDPIVLMGGPAISNPHPFSTFIDAAFIGEAEAGFDTLVLELGAAKKQGASRADLIDIMGQNPAIWTPNNSKKKKAIRAIYEEFSTHVYKTAFPIATIKTVQNHGTVEIMRGCPNGCRFCHAGYYYRPQRYKTLDAIRKEVEILVTEGGYREITLSSLSSGDYPDLIQLLDVLNEEWRGKGVSFQLPSLKISSFGLPLLEKISEVRKSGLTFAVETPNDAWQRIINKDVTLTQTLEILEEAKRRGYRLAKFYFMIGLPIPGGAQAEAEAIRTFIEELAHRIPMQFNINIGTFVPKPHTPFQWCSQLPENEAQAVLGDLKEGLRRHRSIKVSYHAPFVSLLEGIISRGDDRVGELIFSAFKKGARLDAWDEHFSSQIWRSVIEEADWDVLGECIRARDRDFHFPWDDVSIRIGKEYLYSEFLKAIEQTRTSACQEKCNQACGSCGGRAGIVQNTPTINLVDSRVDKATLENKPTRLLFSYHKIGIARFYPHLGISEAFSRAFQVEGLPISYSEGFNPLPRLELIQPMPIGYESFEDFGCIQLNSPIGAEFAIQILPIDKVLNSINSCLPEGLGITRAQQYLIAQGKKIRSLMSYYWGSEFLVRCNQNTSIRERIATAVCSSGIDGAIARFDSSSNDLTIILPEPKLKTQSLASIIETCIPNKRILDYVSITRVHALTANGGYFEFFS